MDDGRNFAIPILIVLAGATAAYAICSVVEKHIPPDFEIPFAIVTLVACLVAAYKTYIWIDERTAELPTPGDMIFRLKWLYHAPGMPDALREQNGHRLTLGSPTPRASLRGTHRTTNEDLVNFRRLIRMLTNEKGDEIVAAKVVEHDGEIRKMIEHLRENQDLEKARKGD
jgi:hypothetical protein